MVKKVLSLMLAGCLVIGVSGLLLAAERKTVTTDVLGVLSGSINIEYEKPLDKNNSLVLSGSVIDSDEGDTEYSGFGLACDYRRYINDKMNYKAKAGEGFFVAGTAGFAMLDLEDHGRKTDETYLLVGGLFGFKYIFDGGFTMEAAAGPVYVMGDDFYDYEVEGVNLGISLKVGYTW
jgi:hypothetical protein